jgi:hypothetical protein
MVGCEIYSLEISQRSRRLEEHKGYGKGAIFTSDWYIFECLKFGGVWVVYRVLLGFVCFIDLIDYPLIIKPVGRFLFHQRRKP